MARAQDHEGQDSELRLGSVDGSVDRELMPCQGSAEYVDGHILFVHDNILMARPFDSESLEFLGPAQPILGEVMSIPAAHLSIVSAAATGVLAYSSGGGGFGNSQLYEVDPFGGTEQAVNTPLITFGFDLDPQGKRLAMALPDQQNGTFDIWLLDLERDLRTRLTFNPESELQPVWSPDGQWLVFASDEDGRANLYRKRASGTGSSERLFTSDQEVYPTDWSADGALISFTLTDSLGSFNLGFFDVQEGAVRMFREHASYSTGMGRFSPDGKWVGYLSDETGEPEVFVESLVPEGGALPGFHRGGILPGLVSRGRPALLPGQAGRDHGGARLPGPAGRAGIRGPGAGGRTGGEYQRRHLHGEPQHRRHHGAKSHPGPAKHPAEPGDQLAGITG